MIVYHVCKNTTAECSAFVIITDFVVKSTCEQPILISFWMFSVYTEQYHKWNTNKKIWHNIPDSHFIFYVVVWSKKKSIKCFTFIYISASNKHNFMGFCDFWKNLFTTEIDSYSKKQTR